jgi:hypothetical protein
MKARVNKQTVWEKKLEMKATLFGQNKDAPKHGYYEAKN